ncbi:MAG: acetoacetate decarboxylase family protein [SAR324 cluster bacterium]|nr:acetoacetate decarboxylase family protein [SAR324 cluster bacterium]
MSKITLTSKDFFKGIIQKTNQEYAVKLPIFYYDNTTMTAIFTASTRALKKYLPEELCPVEAFPGKSLVALSAFEYRHTDIGPYNEFSVAALVNYPGKSIPGLSVASQLAQKDFQAFILSLPVNSEVARKGGVELSGYPKFMADIEWGKEDSDLNCTVSVKGNLLVKMQGKKLSGKKGAITRTKIFTHYKSSLLGANLYVNPQQFSQSFHGKSAQFEVGTGHPMCDLLKDLKLGSRALIYQFSAFNQAILFDSKNIIDI